MTREVSLRSIKALHTVIWLIFALCIVAIPILGWLDRFRLAGWLMGLVLLEVLVLVLNDFHCPLTAVAARYTADRRDNFDIYLPVWLARHNQTVFGTLFVVGVLFTLARWTNSTHAILIWLSFVLLAVLNGGFREHVLMPRLGEQSGHVISTIMLSALILFVTWIALPWIGPATARAAWRLGTLWLALTMAFEFLAGHYLFHTSWARLLAQYNVFRGRIWILALLATFSAPILVFHFQRS